MALKHLFKITFFVLFMVSVINANVSVASGQNDNSDQASSSYKLVWADEFNKDGSPDPCNWTYEQGFVRNQ